MIYAILGDDLKHPLDAKIELEGESVMLHSRGGATGGRPARNPDYQKALIRLISRLRVSRLAGAPVIKRVLLDSLPARRLPIEDRVLLDAAEIAALSDEEVASFASRRAMKKTQAPTAKGGNPTKALRFETVGIGEADLVAVLHLVPWSGGGGAATAIARLPSAELRKVTASHVGRAVLRLLEGGDHRRFAESKDYDVVLEDGERLAPKKVFALALEEALGIEIFPGHFSAGWGQPCFEIIQAAGFQIIGKAEQPLGVAGDWPASDMQLPDHRGNGAVEGGSKMVLHRVRERDRKLAARKKVAFLAQHGTLHCERCKFEPAKFYGSMHGNACIEVHHDALPLKDMPPGHFSSLDDLKCLCANCHRVTHRELSAAG